MNGRDSVRRDWEGVKSGKGERARPEKSTYVTGTAPLSYQQTATEVTRDHHFSSLVRNVKGRYNTVYC